jgi:hypothetical protein
LGQTGAPRKSDGTRDDGGAQVVKGVSGRTGGEGVEKDARGFGTAAHLDASLIDAAVATQQVQYFTQSVVIMQIAVEQLEQSGVGWVS